MALIGKCIIDQSLFVPWKQLKNHVKTRTVKQCYKKLCTETSGPLPFLILPVVKWNEKSLRKVAMEPDDTVGCLRRRVAQLFGSPSNNCILLFLRSHSDYCQIPTDHDGKTIFDVVDQQCVLYCGIDLAESEAKLLGEERVAIDKQKTAGKYNVWIYHPDGRQECYNAAIGSRVGDLHQHIQSQHAEPIELRSKSYPLLWDHHEEIRSVIPHSHVVCVHSRVDCCKSIAQANCDSTLAAATHTAELYRFFLKHGEPNNEPPAEARASLDEFRQLFLSMNNEDYPVEYKTLIGSLGLELHTVPGLGNCMFLAVSDQSPRVPGNDGRSLRARVCDEMSVNSQRYQEFVADVPFKRYVQEMRRDGTYGTHLELVALCNILA